MITAVDTNVLLDVFGADETFGERSRTALRRCLAEGSVVACDPVWAEVASFFPYAVGFTGGVHVGCGDVTGDGRAEIITGPDAGGGPHVRALAVDVVTGVVTPVAELLPYHPAFPGGVRVAAVDLDGDDRAELLTGAGPGGGPHVRVVETDGVSRLELLAYPAGFTGGVFVAGPLP